MNIKQEVKKEPEEQAEEDPTENEPEEKEDEDDENSLLHNEVNRHKWAQEDDAPYGQCI